MELLYVWINSNSTGYIQKEGFNFSPEYRFIMEYSKEKWILKEDSSFQKKRSLFKTSVIENVTAIIGENGVGKTSLLSWLSRLDCMPFNRQGEMDSRVEQFENMKALSLLIFREKDECVIYHDFGNEQFENQTSINKIVSTLDKDICQKIVGSATEFYNITKIFLTNSSYTRNLQGISKATKLDSIYFSPTAFSVISREYFDSLIKKSEIMPSILNNKHMLTSWNMILAGSKTVDNFQEVCDILYFDKLLKENKMENYRQNKICIDLEVWADLAYKLLEKKYYNFHHGLSLNEKDEHKKIFYRLYKEQKKAWSQLSEKIPYVIKVLVCNLIYEVCLCFDTQFPEIKSILECHEWLNKLIDETFEEKMLKESRNFTKELETIEKLYKVVGDVQEKEDIFLFNNKLMKESTVISLDIQPKKYQDFLQLISEEFENGNSFVLRYIRIGNLKMSSGERAFQNFFLWMNLMPKFHKVMKIVPEGMKETVLLLIDEIDLYAHPEWQKNYISYFLQEIENQFGNHKVQVIFTTHSPLCLSDIPIENTIYLKNTGGQCVVDKQEHSQTFGKDVFRILNDAFYLNDSTMGNFAKKKIDEIFETIRYFKEHREKSMDSNEYENLNEKISYIGNDLLRYKLQDMLLLCLSDRQEQLKVLQMQHKAIERKIKQLEKEQ